MPQGQPRALNFCSVHEKEQHGWLWQGHSSVSHFVRAQAIMSLSVWGWCQAWTNSTSLLPCLWYLCFHWMPSRPEACHFSTLQTWQHWGSITNVWEACGWNNNIISKIRTAEQLLIVYWKLSESSSKIRREIEVYVLCRNKIGKTKTQLEHNL